jgi:hypothetical protein
MTINLPGTLGLIPVNFRFRRAGKSLNLDLTVQRNSLLNDVVVCSRHGTYIVGFLGVRDRVLEGKLENFILVKSTNVSALESVLQVITGST